MLLKLLNEKSLWRARLFILIITGLICSAPLIRAITELIKAFN